MDHKKLENSSSDGNIRPPYLTPEKSVFRSRSNRIRHGTMDRFKIGKGACQGCILSPFLFNLYVEYNMQNARLDEAQTRIKIAGETSITSDVQMTPPLWQRAKTNSRLYFLGLQNHCGQ